MSRGAIFHSFDDKGFHEQRKSRAVRNDIGWDDLIRFAGIVVRAPRNPQAVCPPRKPGT
jgi:hypothetical protein